MAVQGRNILLFVDSCAAHSQDTSCLRSTKVVYYPLNCASMLQCLHLGIIKGFKLLYRKHLVQKAVCLVDSGNDVILNITVFQVAGFQSSSLMTSCTVKNCELFLSLQL
jgi:hypothetical protein